MSDSKGNISNYHGKNRWRSIFTQGIGTFTNQALDKIWKDMILGIGEGTDVTYLLVICNPKIRQLQPFNLGTWNATTLPQWGRLHLAGYSQDAESPKTLSKIPFSHSVWDVEEPQVYIWAPFSEIVHYTQVPRCKRRTSANSETFQLLPGWVPSPEEWGYSRLFFGLLIHFFDNVHMHVEVRGQPLALFLSSCPPCIFETMSVSQWDLMLSGAQVSWYIRLSSTESVRVACRDHGFTWMAGIELRASYLNDTHFTDWAISLAR